MKRAYNLGFARSLCRAFLSVFDLKAVLTAPPDLSPLPPEPRGLLFIASHQGFADYLATLALVPHPFRFIIPGSGISAFPFLESISRKMENIHLMDKGIQSPDFGKAENLLRSGENLGIMVPEHSQGLSWLPDELLLASLLALKSGAPVIPLASDGATAVLPQGSLLPTVGTIRMAPGQVEFPIQVPDGGIGKGHIFHFARILSRGIQQARGTLDSPAPAKPEPVSVPPVEPPSETDPPRKG